MSCLLFRVQFHDARFHGLNTEGRPEWPPSPARLFQALVAGTAKGAALCKEDREALAWLEGLAPPTVVTPVMHKGQSFSHFMPNNDLDTVGGDPMRVAEIRTATKWFSPQIFDWEMPLLYVWSFDDGMKHAERLREVAACVYQLGRGVDMAWAVAEILDVDSVEARLAAQGGDIYRPVVNAGRALACPIPGSLNSLIDRYEKSRTRFKTLMEPAPTRIEPSRMKVVSQTFAQPPKPRFKHVPYDSMAVRLLYELRDMTAKAAFLPWPQREAVHLVETIRNGVAAKLQEALPEKAEIVRRVLGLCRDATEADKASRIRIIPLPSVGHQHADHGIRRVLVEISPNCPLAAADLAWAFAQFGMVDHATGQLMWMLVAAEDRGMLAHYGTGDDSQDGFQIWCTVTPMALPIPRPHGRRSGSERAEIERRAAAAVALGLRHAGITSKATSIRVQGEPFDAKGAPAQDFAPGTRFSPARLWHAEIVFAHPVAGPFLAGDGRYLGLGLMRPVTQVEGVRAFVTKGGLLDHADSQTIARALRRAVMALVQGRLGSRTLLPTFFSGHEVDGSPARRGSKSHLAFVFDEAGQRLLVIAPHLLEKRHPTSTERRHLRLLDAALAELHELRAGSAGLLKLQPSTIFDGNDPLFAQATTWISQTEYRPTRHGKRTTPKQAIVTDVGLELRRRGFPIPANIEPVSVSFGPRGGISARLKLGFSTAVKGPLLLGKTCNLGGGLFVAVP